MLIAGYEKWLLLLQSSGSGNVLQHAKLLFTSDGVLISSAGIELHTNASIFSMFTKVVYPNRTYEDAYVGGETSTLIALPGEHCG